MSKEWRTRPSEIIDVKDPLNAYYLDRAVHAFGSAVEADIRKNTQGAKNEKESRAKAMRTLEKWLGTQRFKDPIGR